MDGEMDGDEEELDDDNLETLLEQTIADLERAQLRLESLEAFGLDGLPQLTLPIRSLRERYDIELYWARTEIDRLNKRGRWLWDELQDID